MPHEMPTNHHAERQVLASIAFDPERLYEARELVNPDDFHHPRHRLIFDGMVTLAARGEPILHTTLAQVLRDAGKLEEAGGDSFVGDILADGFTTEFLDANARIVRDLAQRRRLITTCLGIAHAAAEPIDDPRSFFDDAERQVLHVTSQRVADTPTDMASAIDEAEALTEEAARTPGGIIGVATGFPTLDRRTRGLKRQELIVAAGRPGSGKSAFAGGIAVHAACNVGAAVALFSLEMSRAAIAQRMRSYLSGVPGGRLSSGLLSEDDRAALDRANARLRAAPMRIDDRGDLTPLEIAAAARRYGRDLGGLDLIVVDYLQLVKVKGRSNGTREQEVAEASRSLKALAKELQVPVLALAQVSRKADERTDKRPQLSDLRESGAIEADADVVLLIHRASQMDARPENRGLAEIIIAKQRNGETGPIGLRFDGARCRFHETQDGAPGGEP